MLTEERKKRILEILEEKEVVKLGELVDKIGTSESTIRRDLNALEEEGMAVRVHGGATLSKKRFEEPSYKEKEIVNIEAKREIARYAATLIEDGDCIYLDAGSTSFEMIEMIDKKDIIVVTNGLNHINALIEKDIDSYILGGKVKAKTKAVTGAQALKNLEKFRFDKCFIGANSIDVNYNLTTPDSQEAVIKNQAIKNSKEAYVLADSSKFESVSFVEFAKLEEVIIITEKEIENMEEYYKKTKMKVVR